MKSIKALDDFGRTQLSENFYMRDFLYSEISNFYSIPNIPDDPELAIKAGTALAKELLEPLFSKFGQITIRSAYRSSAVNDFGNKNKLNCASNEKNFGHHIWDRLDSDDNIGATACIVIPAFYQKFQEKGEWQKLAWWIHDNLPYSSMYFFPKLWAFNLRWCETPEKWIKSYAEPKGTLTKPGMDNHSGCHQSYYKELL